MNKRTVYNLEFNRTGNLFVGDAAENQQLGRQQESAEQAREKAKAVGDAQEVERQTKLFAENAVDVPKGRVDGRELTSIEEDLLDAIEVRHHKQYPGLTPSIVKDIKTKKLSPTRQYTIAIDDFDNLRTSIRQLTSFSKIGSPKANQEIRVALQNAVTQQRRIADLLNGG